VDLLYKEFTTNRRNGVWAKTAVKEQRIQTMVWHWRAVNGTARTIHRHNGK